MVRDGRWKYLRFPASDEVLFDLAEDPGELTNRAGDSACAAALASLREKLAVFLASPACETTGPRAQ